MKNNPQADGYKSSIFSAIFRIFVKDAEEGSLTSAVELKKEIDSWS